MRSRAESLRRWLEQVLRAVAFAAVLGSIALVWHVLRTPDAVRAEGGGVREAFERWSTRESPGRAHVSFAAMPAAELRDWAAALRGAGTALSWESASLPPTGVSVEPVPDPRHPARIWVAAPKGSKLSVSDDLGALETVAATEDSGTVISAARVAGMARVRVSGVEATAAVRDRLDLKPVLLLAAAGWEGKFVMASLEEYGWKVDARFVVSSKESVTQGPRASRIDTDHYAAVVILDSSAAPYAADIGRYVRSGGGLLAAGEGARLPTLASLFGGRVGRLVEGGAFDEAGNADGPPRRALALSPIEVTAQDAVILEHAPGGEVAAVARRVGDGRVLQVGYQDTWRWRMAGLDEEPVRGYRNWWAAMVSSVAHAKRTALPAATPADPTPLATLVSVLGSPRPEAGEGTHSWLAPELLRWLFGVALVALLAEWASRRLRGAP